MNTVCLMGNICFDVELKYSGGENATAFLNNTVAVKRDYKNKQTGEYDSDFIKFSCFGKTAEFIKQYFTRGDKIALTGSLQTDDYTDQNGQKRSITKVVVTKADFVEKKGNGGNPAGVTPPTPNVAANNFNPTELNNDLPWS